MTAITCHGHTALHAAVQEGRAEVLEWLLTAEVGMLRLMEARAEDGEQPSSMPAGTGTWSARRCCIGRGAMCRQRLEV